MAPCRCGTSNADDARFCSACGDALDGRSVLLGVSSTVTNVATTGGVDRRWTAIVGVLLAAVIGWSVWSGGSGDQASVDRATPSNATTLPDARSSTTRPSTTASPTTTRQPPTARGVAPTRSLVGDGGPLFGETTGLRLVIGNTTYGPSILDLDTGELVAAPKGVTAVEPLMVSGGFLIARNGGRMVAVPADDLAAEPTLLLPDDGNGWIELASRAARSDGRAWVLSYEATVSFMLVDLATGQPVDSGIDGLDEWSGTGLFSFGSPNVAPLFDHRSGGIYEFDDGSYREVALGHLIAADDRRVLREECDARMRCVAGWFDRDTWQPLDLAMPPLDMSEIQFVGGSDWLQLVRYGPNGVTVTLFDVETGRTQEIDSNQYEYYGVQPAVSPDGRWLASIEGVNLVILDLDTGAEWAFEYRGGNGSMVFTAAEVGYVTPLVDSFEWDSGE